MKPNNVLPPTVYGGNTPVLSPAVLGGIERLSMRYDLPERCPITRADLIQEACLALLEALGRPCMGGRKVYSIARKAMQTALTRYLSPVTRSLDDTLYTDDSGNPVTLADTLADDSDSFLSPSGERMSQRDRREAALDSALAYIAQLDSLLAAGTITPANYRKKKHRFLHKLRRQLSQNPQ